MVKLTVLMPNCPEKSKTLRLRKIMDYALKGYDYELIRFSKDFKPVKGGRILFVISLGQSGINLEYYKFLKKIRLDQNCFEDSVGSVLIDGNSELYTKEIGRELVFSANLAGCAFPGRPLVEGTASLNNFNIVAMNLATDNMGAYLESGRQLVENLLAFKTEKKIKPKILVLHASCKKTSNTLGLWKLVKSRLNSCQIKEINLRNGAVIDCIGCPYKTCLHFGEKEECFYGGVIVEDVYPAILECDALLLLCPNYNDAVGANIAAFINRLTALFRKTRFFDKSLYAIIVSGYSGGDVLAQQLISGLNMNKTFILPPRFALIETANSPGSVFNNPGLEERVESFARRILNIDAKEAEI